MSNDSDRKLIWRGTETVHAVQRAIEEGRHIEIALPADVHHALFARIYPGRTSAGLEILDVTGGADLIRTVSSVASLEKLGQLVTPLRDRGYRVRLGDPAILMLTPPRVSSN